MSERPYTVLRTAVGSPVAPSVIAALKAMPGVRVVGVDAAPQACGFLAADAGYVVPRADDPAFLPEMLRLCAAENVDLLFPDLDEELLLLAEARADFAAIGTQILLSPAPALRRCDDKYETFQFFRRHAIPTPETWLPEEIEAIEPSGRLVLKPRRGRGSQGVFVLDDAPAVATLAGLVEAPLVQRHVAGVEYTVDTLSDLDGRFLYASVRERLATDSGISVRGRTLRHPAVEDYARQIVEALGLVGPACVQGIEDAESRLWFIEVNPRIAGSAVLSMEAGAPLIADALRLARGEPPVGIRRYREGLVMLRYWDASFVDTLTEAPEPGER